MGRFSTKTYSRIIMQVTLFSVGKLKKNRTLELFEEYNKGLHGNLKLIGVHNYCIKEIPQSKESTAALRSEQEGKKLLSLVDNTTRLILLDERGENLTSREFASYLKKSIDDGVSNIIFSIGGTDGFCPQVRSRADKLISFGKLTWAHQLARIMLVEQLYRATTIILNHPYHRD